jgi:hypothetical protein
MVIEHEAIPISYIDAAKSLVGAVLRVCPGLAGC